ncbi:MAG: molybdopterin cofactor-binding domain-containing protein [Ardenticatenales bacterium]
MSGDVSRRDVLRGVAGLHLAGILGPFDRVLGFVTPGMRAEFGGGASTATTAADAAASPDAIAQDAGAALSQWVTVGADGVVAITVHKGDLGQGVRTGLAMIVAEELDADWSSVTVVQAPADGAYGNQGVGGSGSTTGSYTMLRNVGAAARLMLVETAAARWGIPAARCRTERGIVRSDDGREATYAALAVDAAKRTPPAADAVQLKNPSAFTLIGQPRPRVDNADVVTGRAQYALDPQRPGTRYAVISKSPFVGGRLRSFDDAAARAVPGVIDVVNLGSGVAVVGEHTWAALKGRAALDIEWDDRGNAALSTDSIMAAKAAALPEPAALDAPGARIVTSTLDLPFLAHATMEPMTCMAEVAGDRVTVWVGTQSPDSARRAAAQAAGVAEANATVHVMLMGGGFGRRGGTEWVREAVTLSKRLGAPIKLLYPRDEDMRTDNFRPASHHRLRGAVDGMGKIIAWQHHVASGGSGNGPNSGLAGQARPNYTVAGIDAQGFGVADPVSVGAWRSVSSSQLNPANEVLMDMLAAAAGQDPLAFRLANLTNNRLRGVLQLAAEKADWGRSLPPRHGRGIAACAGWGSYVAQVCELEVLGDGRVKVHRVVAAVDCGQAVNPLSVQAQIQGASVDGLSTALGAGITIDGGRVQERTFTDYVWFRMADTPSIEVHVVTGKSSSPGGIGEVGYPAMPAAVMNAVYAATGVRVTRLPIQPGDLVAAGAPTAEPTRSSTAVPTMAPTTAPTEVPPTAPPTAAPPRPTDGPDGTTSTVFLPFGGTGRP